MSHRLSSDIYASQSERNKNLRREKIKKNILLVILFITFKLYSIGYWDYSPEFFNPSAISRSMGIVNIADAWSDNYNMSQNPAKIFHQDFIGISSSTSSTYPFFVDNLYDTKQASSNLFLSKNGVHVLLPSVNSSGKWGETTKLTKGIRGYSSVQEYALSGQLNLKKILQSVPNDFYLSVGMNLKDHHSVLDFYHYPVNGSIVREKTHNLSADFGVLTKYRISDDFLFGRSTELSLGFKQLHAIREKNSDNLKGYLKDYHVGMGIKQTLKEKEDGSDIIGLVMTANYSKGKDAAKASAFSSGLRLNLYNLIYVSTGYVDTSQDFNKFPTFGLGLNYEYQRIGFQCNYAHTETMNDIKKSINVIDLSIKYKL